MESFKDRKKSFEEKFARDLDLQFKVECRACRQFGLWAGMEAGCSDEDAQNMAQELVMLRLESAGHEKVLEKVRTILPESKTAISDHMLNLKLEELIEQSKEYFMEQTG
jgi:hypothetical protein